MKKYIIPLFMFIFSFILIGNVNAKNVVLDFDNSNGFNYFYELKNNTKVYQTLVEWNNFINEKLKIFAGADISNIMDKYNDYYIFITNSSVNSDYMSILWTNFAPEVSIKNDSFNYNFFMDYYIDKGNKYMFYFEFDKTDFSFKSVRSGWSTSVGVNTQANYKFDIEKAELYSSFYYFGTKKLSISSTDITDLDINTIKLDDEKFYIEDNREGLKFFDYLKRFFNGQGVLEIEDNSYLSYFKNYKYIYSTDFLSLYRIVNYYNDSTYFLPNNYNSFTLDNDTEDGYYLVPNNYDGVDNEFYNNTLYFYSNNSNGSININFYDLGADDSVKNHNFRYTIKGNIKALKLNSIKLKTIYNYMCDKFDLGESCNYSNFKNYVIYIYTDTPRYTYTFYYNSDYFTSYKNNGDITFNNPLSSNDVTLSYSKNNNFVQDNKSVSDVGLGIDDSSSSFNIDLSNVTDIFKGLLNNLVKCINSIFSLVFEMFSCLPSELQQLLYFSLFGGIVIMIFKILKG